MYDQLGWAYEVLDNDRDSLTFDRKTGIAPGAKSTATRVPKFTLGGGPGSLVRLAQKSLVDTTATALRRDRFYALLPRVGSGTPGYSDNGSFSALNHRFRELTDKHLSIIDDRSSKILLAASAQIPLGV